MAKLPQPSEPAPPVTPEWIGPVTERFWPTPPTERRYMNLGDFRRILLKSVFDDSQDLLDNLTANQYINMAAKHISNWADRQDQAVCVATEDALDVHGNATQDLKEVVFYLGMGVPYFAIDRDITPFRRALAVYRTNFGPNKNQTVQLDLIPFEDISIYTGEAEEEKPKVAVARQSLFVIRPIADIGGPGLTLRMHYVYSLPDMILDDDTPGQHNGEGTANALPGEYHPLVAVFAIKMALAAENADMSQWEAMYTEMLAELHATFAERRGTRTGGSK